jgi:hypothetical protein
MSHHRRLVALAARVRALGCTLRKAPGGFHFGSSPVRYLVKDEHGWLCFRNLDEVKRFLARREVQL